MLWGRHDPIIKNEWADKLGDYFADNEVSAADGSGHFVHWEEPDMANPTMIDFFKRVL